MDDRYLLIAAARNPEAARLFDLNQESESDVYKWELTLEDYKTLSATRIFEYLNAECGCLIDNYEDDKLCGDDLLLHGMTVVGKVLCDAKDFQQKILLERLAALFVLAFSAKTCVYFYF